MFPLAMITASLVKSRYTGFQVLMFLSTPVFMMSGFTWPLDQMPRTIQLLASAFPATPALLAMRTLAVKSGSFSAIRTELAWMAAQFIAYTLVAIALLHGQERRKLLNSNEINRELAGGDEPGTASQTA
jgi:ABC-2 type transport system permease protein